MWEPPKEYPNLAAAKYIGLDTETRDPNLMTHGPGGVRQDGYVIGISLAADENNGWYFPIRHDGGGNLDPENTLAYLRDVLSTTQPKVGANIIYDLEWLRAEGVEVRGPKYDIQIAEPLLDENQYQYSLEAISQRRLGLSKNEDLLAEACVEYRIPLKDAKANMWRFHSKWVGPYAETDGILPLQNFAQQEALLREEDLWSVFMLETELIDLLLEMRFQGIPVDVDKAVRIRDKLQIELDEALKNLNDLAGTDVDIWSGKVLGMCADNLGLWYPTTAKGNPSFEASWLEQQEQGFFSLVAKARKLDRAGAVFIQSKILDLQVNGLIHPRFRQVRGDDKGTRSGRFSSEGPNMQQVPARDPYIAPLVRSIFVPMPGGRWGVFDYSQQEPRVTVHYASVCEFAGAAEAVRRYNENPDTDYHQLTADMVKEFAGLIIDRSNVAKPMNLGLAYGMGKDKMAAELGLTKEQITPIFNAYHKALPYVKLLGDECAAVATDRGYIKTILGRRRRFNLFGPRGWKAGIVPKPFDEAVQEWGAGVVRYFTHKALNALVQGSSADMMKKAMLDCFKEGIIPHMTIHDELDVTINSDAEARRIRDIMVNAIKLHVPLKVDVELGPSWGEAKKVKL